jgi:hypothetical protein
VGRNIEKPLHPLADDAQRPSLVPSAGEEETRKRTHGTIKDDGSMVEDVLKFASRSLSRPSKKT